jgi:uncharacterized protein YdhG (YjbR/CyaY superfamily)
MEGRRSAAVQGIPGSPKAMTTPSALDAYIAAFPDEVAERLSAMRATIREQAPLATERISYGIPTFHLNGNLVHFAGFARHVGFYPGPTGVVAFAAELKRYKRGKGSVQFPHDEPLPLDVVARVVQFRVAENTRPLLKRRDRPGHSGQAR